MLGERKDGAVEPDEMMKLLERMESHARIGTAWRNREAEMLPAGSELPSDLFDAGSAFKLVKKYDGPVDTTKSLVVLKWNVFTGMEPDTCLAMHKWKRKHEELGEMDAAVVQVIGEEEASRVCSECLSKTDYGNHDKYNTLTTKEMGIVQGPTVPEFFDDWWVSTGLRALMPEVVAASDRGLVLDLWPLHYREKHLEETYPEHTLKKVSRIVHRVFSSTRFYMDRELPIKVYIAPRPRKERTFCVGSELFAYAMVQLEFNRCERL